LRKEWRALKRGERKESLPSPFPKTPPGTKPLPVLSLKRIGIAREEERIVHRIKTLEMKKGLSREGKILQAKG